LPSINACKSTLVKGFDTFHKYCILHWLSDSPAASFHNSAANYASRPSSLLRAFGSMCEIADCGKTKNLNYPSAL
jgi:hypothetical protein